MNSHLKSQTKREHMLHWWTSIFPWVRKSWTIDSTGVVIHRVNLNSSPTLDISDHLSAESPAKVSGGLWMAPPRYFISLNSITLTTVTLLIGGRRQFCRSIVLLKLYHLLPVQYPCVLAWPPIGLARVPYGPMKLAILIALWRKPTGTTGDD